MWLLITYSNYVFFLNKSMSTFCPVNVWEITWLIFLLQVLAWSTSRSTSTYRGVSQIFQVQHYNQHIVKSAMQNTLWGVFKTISLILVSPSIKPFSQQNYIMQATGPSITGLSAINTYTSFYKTQNIIITGPAMLPPTMFQVMRVRQVCLCPLVPPLGRAEV